MAKGPKGKETLSGDISAKATGAGTAGERLSSWPGREWVWGLILILAVILTYQPVWKAGYLWDDDTLVNANPCIVGPLGLKEIWTTEAADICPLTITTFWVEHALWGLRPLPYHLVNVLMHGACAVILWRVLRTLQVPGAWLGAALWALHPVQVESVAWIAEMKNTESGVFFLLSTLFFVKWHKTRDSNGGSGGALQYGLTLLFAALAMAGKSSTVILPVVLCLCAWWMEGRWNWRNLARVAPIFLMSAASSALAVWMMDVRDANPDPQWVRKWPERMVTAGDAVWFYLGKLVWPHPLITIYPRWEVDAGRWFSYLPLLAVITVLFILWFNQRSWSRPWLMAWAYFLVALFPILGLLNMSFFRYSFVADHFQYLAGMAPLALAGTGMARLVDYVIPGRFRLQSVLGVVVLLVLGLLSWQRARVYESEESLWTDALARNPNCWLGYNNLGTALLERGKVDEATAHFQRALELNPNYAYAHNNLGLALFPKRVDEAIAQYRKALELDPKYGDAHINLGVALFNKGAVDEAIANYQKGLEINPNNAEAHSDLGAALFKEGQVDEAIAQYQKALELNRNDSEARNNLGSALLQKGQVDEATVEFQKAVEINHNYAEAYNNLGNALGQRGQADEAIANYQKALEINPGYAEAHNNLGTALFNKGQVDEAMAEYQRALEINSNYDVAHNNLGNALMQKGRMDEAVMQYQKALEINPNFAAARYNLGIALARKGQLKEGR